MKSKYLSEYSPIPCVGPTIPVALSIQRTLKLYQTIDDIFKEVENQGNFFQFDAHEMKDMSYERLAMLESSNNLVMYNSQSLQALPVLGFFIITVKGNLKFVQELLTSMGLLSNIIGQDEWATTLQVAYPITALISDN